MLFPTVIAVGEQLNDKAPDKSNVIRSNSLEGMNMMAALKLWRIEACILSLITPFTGVWWLPAFNSNIQCWYTRLKMVPPLPILRQYILSSAPISDPGSQSVWTWHILLVEWCPPISEEGFSKLTVLSFQTHHFNLTQTKKTKPPHFKHLMFRSYVWFTCEINFCKSLWANPAENGFETSW